MQLQIRLFAMLREAAGTESVALDVPDAASGAELRALLANAHPELAPFLDNCRIAASQRFVTDDYRFEQPEEVALIPPVSGG